MTFLSANARKAVPGAKNERFDMRSYRARLLAAEKLGP
jgi:hypothetical protein